MNASRKEIRIFCDGGLGNRFNALVSGLAAAKRLELAPVVFWPANNWCRARFDEIFDDTRKLDVDERSLSALAGTLDGFLPLLHDDIASKKLGIPFASAYAWDSLDALKTAASASPRGIFYYPALIPPWLPADCLRESIVALAFHPDVRTAVTRFIREVIGKPFYGIHLRRTDLKVGYSDAEVGELSARHPTARFFVCSDDPLAERLAAAHDNVFTREKTSHVAKKTGQGGWNDITFDDDGRLANNIERGAAQVREAAVDLLILAHSTILGYSGSTFQATARLIGQAAPLLSLERPPAFQFLATVDCHRQLSAKRMQVVDVIEIGNQLSAVGRADEAIRFLQMALNYFPEGECFPFYFNLAWNLMNLKRLGEAAVFAERAIRAKPDFRNAHALAAQINQARVA